MQDYETEEQQIEALKKWWKENATSLILGLSIGAFSLGGWKYYVEDQNDHRIQASNMYVSIMTQAAANNIDDENMKKADQLVAEFSDTPYAALSSLTLAAYEFNKGNEDSAIAHLQWVNKNAQEEEVKHIAQLRLARLFLSQKRYDEAASMLASDHPSAFNARYEELKGDIFVARGEIEQARVAYDKAIEQSATSSRWLKLKRQDLGSSELKKSTTVEPAA